MNSAVISNLNLLLQKHFGFNQFKAGQLDVMCRLLNGNSTLAVFPTGGGKSLCYQLPALALEGLTVVVSPLIALMKDQIDQLRSKEIVAVRLDSSLSFDEYQEAMASIRSGQAKLLYVAPERFFNERFRSALEGVRVSLFAIDEAHCISQWGHNFRPDYLKLARIASQLNVERVLALTATATPEVQDDICAAFDIEPEDMICNEFFRPNLHIRTHAVADSDRTELLTSKLNSQTPGAAIVYVTLQKTAEWVADHCAKAGLDAKAYHAGMDAESRTAIQEWFMHGSNRIVVATIAFGMGIDKSDIRYIYHFNAPKSIENYAQEIGRAGRDGEVSKCEMFLVPEDKITLENFVFGDTPTENATRSFIQAIADQPDEFFISQYQLGNQCDIKTVVVKTLLTYLELDGYLESTSPRFDAYTFKPLVPSDKILAHFSGERRQFAKSVLASATKKKVWFHIDLPQTMNKLNCDRGRIVKALDYFAEKGWLDLRTSGLVHGYRKLNPISAVEAVAATFIERINLREASEIERTNQVVKLARANECQAVTLSSHFGQPLATNCGECTYCRGEGQLKIDDPPAAELDATTIEMVKKLVTENPDVLNSGRAVARMLCGITAPSLTRAKLSGSHPAFGSCSHIPFGHVMQQAGTLF